MGKIRLSLACKQKLTVQHVTLEVENLFTKTTTSFSIISSHDVKLIELQTKLMSR